MHKKIHILAAFLFAAHVLSAQSYYFRHYQVENGLSNNAVICSVQDRQGFLWFGTKDGLDRFDGYSFKAFRNDPDDKGSIGSNFIHCLYEDRNGILWVGTENGLYKYNATTESFSLFPTDNIGHIRDIQMDSLGNLWFISAFILIKYHESTNKLDYYPIDRYFDASSICISSDGSLWASTSMSGALKKYDPASNSFTSFDVFSHSDRSVNTWIEKLYATSNGKILIGTSIHGAKLFDIATSTYEDILTYNPDKTEIFARNFVQTAEDECWIGTESGIFIYNMKTGALTNLRKKYNDPYSISDNAVYTFTRDKEGGIWTGTYFGGINYYPKQYSSFKKFFPGDAKNSLSGCIVREIHEDASGNLWIGTEDAGLNKLDTGDRTFVHFQPTGSQGSISYSNIHGLLITGDELWIGTFEHGLDVMNTKTGKVIRHYSQGPDAHSLKSNFIYCIYQTSSGEIMLGTTRGAFTYNRDADDFSYVPGLPVNWYSSILKDDNGIIWAGTYGNGVNFYNTKTGNGGNFRYIVDNKNSIGSDRINSIFKDSDKTLWFATEGGLCKYNPATNDFKRYTTKNGLPSNFILSLLEDDKRNLWISTSKGLVRFNPRTEELNTYTKDNGLLNDQFNFSSAYKDKSGRMYFGSVKGLISFHPDQIVKNSFIAPVYITGFQIYNKDLTIAKDGSPLQKSITYTDKIQLSHNQSTFSIDFASLSYTAPEMSEYAYKMEGLDKDWTYLKTNRKAYFTELAPGTYIFEVKAANSSGVWNEQKTQLIIEILPPWWTSKWAYFFYVLAGIGIVYYLVRNYHKRVEEKNKRKIEHLEIAKEKEIFQAKIDFFTNVAHEIRTPLTLIKGPLEKVIKKAGTLPEIKDSLRIMDRNTNRLIELSNQLLDFRQTEIQGFHLNFIKENISEIVEDTYISFKPLAEQKSLVFKLNLPSATIHAYIDSEAFSKILNNLFSNAIKYAQSKVFIQLLPPAENGSFFSLEIQNDGYRIPYEMKEKIFEPFFRLKETEKQKGTGIGLALSRSLTQLHKGMLDLKETGNDMNTFILTMPVQQETGFETNGETVNTIPPPIRINEQQEPSDLIKQ